MPDVLNSATSSPAPPLSGLNIFQPIKIDLFFKSILHIGVGSSIDWLACSCLQWLPRHNQLFQGQIWKSLHAKRIHWSCIRCVYYLCYNKTDFVPFFGHPKQLKKAPKIFVSWCCHPGESVRSVGKSPRNSIIVISTQGYYPIHREFYLGWRRLLM